jgi:hypothetical protein
MAGVPCVQMVRRGKLSSETVQYSISYIISLLIEKYDTLLSIY